MTKVKYMLKSEILRFLELQNKINIRQDDILRLQKKMIDLNHKLTKLNGYMIIFVLFFILILILFIMVIL